MKRIVYLLLWLTLLLGIRLRLLQAHGLHNLAVITMLNSTQKADDVFDKLSDAGEFGLPKSYATAGKYARMLDQDSDALKWYELLLENNNSIVHDVDWLFYAESLLSVGHQEEAIESFMMITNDSFLCRKGISLAVAGEFEAGVTLCRSAVDRTVLSKNLVDDLVHIYLSNDDSIAASQILNSFSGQLSEKDEEYWWAIGKQYELEGKWLLSAESYGNAAKLSNDPFNYYYLQGQMAEKEYSWKLAEEAYRNAYNLKPSSLKVNLAIGSILRRVDKYDDAIEWYQNMMGVFPSSNVSELHLGISYYEQAQLDMAHSWYSKALSKNPEDAAVMYGLARTIYDMGNKEEAIYWLIEAIKHRPEQSQWRILMDEWLTE